MLLKHGARAPHTCIAIMARRSKTSQILAMMHYIATVLGMSALCVLGFIFFQPAYVDKIVNWSPFATVAASTNAVAPPVIRHQMAHPITSIEQKRITDWLSRRYRVAQEAIDMLASTAYSTATTLDLDPLLILAVMAIESRFNPFAESPMGAQGLMQVMPKFHNDKFQDLGGAVLNPIANIKVGSLILKEYVSRGGSIEAGLKAYVGAANLDNDGGYSAKVLFEYQNLQNIARGKRVSIFVSEAASRQRSAVVSAT